MTKTDSEFEAFVNRALEKDNPFEPPPELKMRPMEWMASLAQLYADIESFLADHVNRGAIRISYEETELQERYIGNYSARTMLIAIGREEVRLTPVGTLVIGGRGRVDVTGSAGDIRLVLIHKDARRPQDLIKVTIKDETSRDQDAIASPRSGAEDYTWKIATPPPSVYFDELTKSSFYEVLMEVSNA
ncbi:hypothetical protein E0I74_26775 [Rhizobium laguerreae]|uniref:hypothetical protein n=1 Tax=Rhizobium laguerreae TaxID=1076926 RepID=UPI001038CE54|nr:hypothetical protein [Rhizobium laguerreae]TBX74443.1 hypothetical protein E0I74_26775 [Rhizobium laguerreae]